ncbi:MAG TPA: hypothetical protein VD969_05140 [Symbiobacteriaceae bacterium]|nr:hypothetical protein [Symbiobacteriaceae bacterium]
MDLLPGDLAVQSVSTAKKAHRWLSGDILAYEEHMGTSVQQLFFLNVMSGVLTKEPELLASRFRWAPAGEPVAGRWLGGPAGFWVWDRQAGYLRRSLESGEVFEAWSPDGQELLYTEWHCPTPYCPQGASTLWRLDLATGRRQQVAQNAGLAAWSAAGQIAYVQFGESLELVVTDSETGSRLWVQKLGARPKEVEHRWDLYRPQFEGGSLAFTNAQGDWLLSRAESKAVHHIYRGGESRLIWSPGGQHLAILGGRERPRLLVLENPLSEEPTPAMACDAPAAATSGGGWSRTGTSNRLIGREPAQ